MAPDQAGCEELGMGNHWRSGLGRLLAGAAMTALVMIFGAVETSAARAEGVQPVSPSFVFNGNVSQVADEGEDTYVAGSFNAEQKPTGGGAVVSATTGEPEFSKLPPVAGEVEASVSDGSGGWYIAGDFTAVGSTACHDIAHVLSNGTVATGFAPEVNAPIDALALSGSTLYVAGHFSQVDGEGRKYLAAVNDWTGALTSFAPEPNGVVTALLVEGSTAYAAGAFTSIGGKSRSNVAALNGNGEATAFTTTLTSEHPNPDGLVSALAKSGTTLFIGGSFNTVNGEALTLLAGLDDATGEPTSFDAEVVNEGFGIGVGALAVSGDTLYLGGNFQKVGGESRLMAASVNVNTGAVTSWNPELNVTLETEYYGIERLAVVGSSVYLAGYHYGFNDGVVGLKDILRADSATTGKKESWNPEINAEDSEPFDALAVSSSGEQLFIGGGFSGAGKPVSTSAYLVRVLADGALDTSWAPAVTGSVASIAVGPSDVYAYTEGHIVAFNKTTGAKTSFSAGANPNGGPDAMVVAEGNLEVAGEFMSPTRWIAELNGTTGAISSWNPTIDGSPTHNVTRLAASGDTLYIGGRFEEVEGSPRHGVAAFDLTTHELTSLATTCCDTGLESMVVDGSNLYLSGSFSGYFEAGEPPSSFREQAAAVNATTGALTSWNPAKQVLSMSAGASSIYGIDYIVEEEGGSTTLSPALVRISATTGEAEQLLAVSGVRSVDAAGVLSAGGSMIALGETVTGPFARFTGSPSEEHKEEPKGEAPNEEHKAGGEEHKEEAKTTTTTTNGGGGGGMTATISSAEVTTLLISGLGSASRVNITTLLKQEQYVMGFQALEAGTLLVQWYEVPKGAKLAKAKPKPVLVASGQMTFSAAGRGTVHVRITSAGKKLLKHASRLTLTAKASFTATGKATVATTRTFSIVRRK